MKPNKKLNGLYGPRQRKDQWETRNQISLQEKTVSRRTKVVAKTSSPKRRTETLSARTLSSPNIFIEKNEKKLFNPFARTNVVAESNIYIFIYLVRLFLRGQMSSRKVNFFFADFFHNYIFFNFLQKFYNGFSTLEIQQNQHII